ncbi:MAG TPA: pitrilysin family protein [Candidatus Nitrosotenuis sp.]|jgi:zinc protease|nr:pitrilysin family protein [Candidatus Nitrosotenuis sp.]
MKKWIAYITIAMTSFITPSFAEMFKPKTATLKNGLQIVLVENHLAPVVSLSLIYKVGTADDPTLMVGLSHFLEHLMFKGTKKVPKGHFKQKIISKGGNVNAYTSQDYTAYVCDIAVEHLPMVLEIEADRMANLIFDEQETKAEQSVVMEERRSRMDNHPLGQAHEALMRNLFWYHPYGIPPIGYPYHITAYTKEAAENHYRTWYVPNNAIMVVAGDITMEALMPLVEQYFSAIPSKPVPDRHRPDEPPHKGVTQELKVVSPRVSFTNFTWFFTSPTLKTDRENFYPLIVLTQILGGNAISRLYANLVDSQQLAIQADASFDDDSIDPKHLSISATLHPGVKEDDLIRAVNKHIEDIVKDGITEDELRAAKRDLLAGLAFSKDGNSGAIHAFSNLAVGFSIEEIEQYPERINNVTVEQVNTAARKYLSTNPVLIMKIYPEKPQVKDLSHTQEISVHPKTLDQVQLS